MIKHIKAGLIMLVHWLFKINSHIQSLIIVIIIIIYYFGVVCTRVGTLIVATIYLQLIQN